MKSFVYLILAVTCLPFFAVGAFEMYQAAREPQKNACAVGTVTNNVYLTTNNDGVVSGAYHPIIEFTNLSGAQTGFTDRIGSLPADYEAGARVTVYFEPDKPENTRVYSWKRFWLAPTILVLVGVLPALSAFLIMRRLEF